MATVELRFSALPEHVRTARLVAAAVARRAGVDEAVLDEVRLAVGEACTRAVGLHMSNGLDTPVRVALIEEEKKFSIEVGDAVPDRGAATLPGSAPGCGRRRTTRPRTRWASRSSAGSSTTSRSPTSDNGGLIRMSWPASPQPLVP